MRQILPGSTRVEHSIEFVGCRPLHIRRDNYDGEGRRVKKKKYEDGVLDEETVFVYSSGKLIAEYSSKPPAQNPTTSFTITDQLGSPRVLVNSLGQVVSRRDFLPFGEEIVPDAANLRTDASLKYNGDTVRQKFTGYQKDEESGLDFAEARMYENRHGRFTAVDPLLASGKSANPQTFNRYVYVMNNPLIYTDPAGLQAATNLRRFGRGEDCSDWTQSAAQRRRGTVTATGTAWVDVYANGVGPTPPPEDPRAIDPIKSFLRGFNRGIDDTIEGTLKGIGNLGIDGWNGATDTIFNPHQKLLSFGPLLPRFENRLGIERFSYDSPIQEDFGKGFEFGLPAGLSFGAGVFAGGSSLLSVVPETAPLSTTQRLQFHVSRAASKIDAAGDAAFTEGQLGALTNNPGLRPAFRGNRVDVLARENIIRDPNLSFLKSNYNRGPDFVDPNTGRWWDMTTQAQWQKHVRKYGSDGTLLNTQ